MENDVSLTISLHDAQADIFNSPARFKVVAAGRRFGKSYLAANMLLVEALKDTHVGLSGQEHDLVGKEVWYIAPTIVQGKMIMWELLLRLAGDLIVQKWENIAALRLLNGRIIRIKGADDPDSLRGVGLSFVVLDEYAFMKEQVWETYIRPTLSDVEGTAMFIGTPEGENHFFKLYMQALQEGLPEWQGWQFKSIDNPFLPKSDIERARNQLSTAIFSQEYEASFTSMQGEIFDTKWFIREESEPLEGNYYIAVDLAGFSNDGTLTRKEMKIRDESSIAIVKVGTYGWWIKDIVHGQWDVRECALRIMQAYRDYRPVSLGIEKGMAKNAVMPYLTDEMKRLNVFFVPEELTHGNTKKLDRIRWSLQGRAEKGRIKYNVGEWNYAFLKQLADFPSPLAHDDLIDSVSYIDQMASAVYFDTPIFDGIEVLDDMIGM